MLMKRKKYKSVITKRIFRSIRKVSLVLALLVVSVYVGKIGGTNAFFTDSATISGSSFSAGYWVVPEITFTNPHGGEEWQVGSTYDIHWSAASSDPSATAGMAIGIDYACDGGAWTNIIAGIANNGTFSWTMPANISNNCKIKVTATDSHALTNSAESAIFKIKSPIVLNEFIPDPSGDDNAKMPGGEWVELYNNGSLPVDVDGWYLYDSDNNNELEITANNSDNNNNTSDSGETIVPEHGWLVVYRNGDGDFIINNTGSDSIRLYNGPIVTGNLIDLVNYTVANEAGSDDPALYGSKGVTNPEPLSSVSESQEGKTWARYPDGIGAWFDPIPTPGEKNTKSMDLDKFRKYYSDRCIKDGSAVSIKKDPVCDVEFLTWLGVLDAKENVIPETEIPAVESGAIIPADGTIVPTDNAGNDTVAPADNSEDTQDINIDEPADNAPAVIDAPTDPAPADPPKIIEKVIVPDPKPEVIVKEPEVVKAPDPPASI